MHDSSFARMKDVVERHLENRPAGPLRVLDVGSSDVNGTYRPLFRDPQWDYVGLDTSPGPGVDLIVPRTYRWREIASRSFDVVISGQTFEHIEFIWVSVLEVARVLCPGGIFILIVPSSGPEHRYPLDCWRFYPDGLKALAHWADLDVIEARTYWEDEGWPGPDGDQWHDSVLVARKPSGCPRVLTLAKQRLLRWATSLQADKRGVAPSGSGARAATYQRTQR
jgi:SAM-dependent methyltransferase